MKHEASSVILAVKIVSKAHALAGDHISEVAADTTSHGPVIEDKLARHASVLVSKETGDLPRETVSAHRMGHMFQGKEQLHVPNANIEGMLLLQPQVDILKSQLATRFAIVTDCSAGF